MNPKLKKLIAREGLILVAVSFLTLVGGCDDSQAKPRKSYSYLWENNKSTSDFENKEKCYKYKKDVEEDLQKNAISNPQTNTYMVHHLDKLFYSLKLDSCLCEISTTVFKDAVPTHQDYKLKNILTNEIVAGTGLMSFPLTKESIKAVDLHREIVKTYESKPTKSMSKPP